MDLELEELTGRIIASAIEVHKNLGPGFLESIYQAALPIEMQKNGLSVEAQREVRIFYDEREIGLHRLDLIVEKKVVVELKTVKESDDSHVAQVVSYLNATELKVGLLLNFSKAVLKVKRVVY